MLAICSIWWKRTNKIQNVCASPRTNQSKMTRKTIKLSFFLCMCVCTDVHAWKMIFKREQDVKYIFLVAFFISIFYFLPFLNHFHCPADRFIGATKCSTLFGCHHPFYKGVYFTIKSVYVLALVFSVASCQIDVF